MSLSLELENIKLKEEVHRLKVRVDYDDLCNIYNKRSTPKQINNALSKKWEGVLLIIDIDRFNFINDNFGYLIGDDILRNFSKAITLAVYEENAIIGRIGENEFLVFFPKKYDIRFIDKKIMLIKEHVQNIRLLKDNNFILSASIFSSTVLDGDTYETLFYRANQKLIEHKRLRSDFDKVYQQYNRLQESSYYSFENFCIVEQECIKIPYKLLIITIQPIDDSQKSNIEEIEMIKLYESISVNLRSGDFFTQYSETQFLLLCKFVEENKICFIKKRIKETFRNNSIGQCKLKISKFGVRRASI